MKGGRLKCLSSEATDPLTPPAPNNLFNPFNFQFMTKTTFTFEELEAIADLIQFHDDWDELSDRLEVNIKTLFDKVCDLQTELNEGA